MTFRKMLLLFMAASGFTGMAAAEASAERPFFLLRPFLPGYNDSYPPPDDVYYMSEEEYYRYLKRQRRKQRLLNEYYARQDDPDYYYEEEYVPPRKAKKKQAVKPAAKKPAAKTAAKPKPSPSKKAAASKTGTTVAASKPKEQNGETTASINKTGSSSTSGTAGMSCSKAADIVAGYGFDSVKAGSCSGGVYSFNASRAGKSYVVKVNSASGELTEVRKL
jgi:hypothetical protein